MNNGIGLTLLNKQDLMNVTEATLNNMLSTQMWRELTAITLQGTIGSAQDTVMQILTIQTTSLQKVKRSL